MKGHTQISSKEKAVFVALELLILTPLRATGNSIVFF